jgi:hypothetical protein
MRMLSLYLTSAFIAAQAALIASAHADAADNSSRMARLHHACAVVMGLPQPGQLYDACVKSLDNSLSALAERRLVTSDRTICANKGLTPGTPAFADCMRTTDQSSVAAPH